MKTVPWRFQFLGRSLLLCAACLAMAGCRERPRATAKTSGVVMYEGKPLHLGRVVFVPEAGRGATGQINTDGSFVLRTFEPGDGALVGHHRIAIIAAVLSKKRLPNGAEPPPEWLIPQHYGSADTSGLECDVKPGVENHVVLHLSGEKTEPEPPKDPESPSPVQADKNGKDE